MVIVYFKKEDAGASPVAWLESPVCVWNQMDCGIDGQEMNTQAEITWPFIALP